MLALACGTDREAALDVESTASVARPEIVEMLRDDLRSERHPADGGGRAWLLPAPASDVPARAGVPGRWTLAYEAGPLGVAEGGAIYLQVSPFWGWSPPQTLAPEAPGFTRVTTDAPDLHLETSTPDAQLLAVEVRGRALAAGERIQITYGEGPAGARADRFAEEASAFWIAVDGDGDGLRALLPDAPTVAVRPGPPAQLQVLLPATARPGEAVRVRVSVLDALGNAGVEVTGPVRFVDPPAALALPDRVVLAPEDGGTTGLLARVRGPGVHRLRAVGPEGLEAESNPLVVEEDGPRLLWGDLHGHSAFSDGTGTPEDWYRYARDVAALDVAALTDHDHWGIPFLDASPELWERIQATVARFHEPGRFVALLGFEWTSWTWGHRHVLFFSDEGRIASSLDAETDSPQELWNALRGRPALTVPHHPAGGPIAVDWSIPPDPELEPVVEIVSVHGASEAADAPRPIYDAMPGHFVREVVARGYRLGFVGSGDGHDGHPGLTQLGSGGGGLAGIWSEAATREGVLSALRARRVYATNGPRIFLHVAWAGHPMGAEVPAAVAASAPLRIHAAAPGPLARVELIRSGALHGSFDAAGRRELSLETTLEELRAGEWVYVRVVQEDQGAAWSSPIWLGPDAGADVTASSGTGR